MSPALACRFCDHPLDEVVVDLGSSPLSNANLSEQDLQGAEKTYPLCVYRCTRCLLVQLPMVESPEEIFSDYDYFSSFSASWLDHARRYVEQMIDRFDLAPDGLVVEIASNDGYLLKNFVERGHRVLGIEPAANVARAAEKVGVPTRVAFFGAELARELAERGDSAALVVGNNVLAHVPDLNDFVAGLKLVLSPEGLITLEFPHLVRLIEGNQFDTIYHEHFSYFSMLAVDRIIAAHGLRIFDVEELPTHGGSLRIFVCHEGSREVSERASSLLATEKELGLEGADYYAGFSEKVRETKRHLLEFLIAAKRQGRSVVGYGAPAKGNTLLNYCGIRTDFVDYTVDRSPHKQGLYLPGSRIPIHAPDRIRETRPDYVLILPWNLRDEITEQMADVKDWGGRFVIAVPELTVLE